MTRTHPELDARIVAEASDWFIEFSEGTLEAAGREHFDAWLRRSPEHVQAYLKISTLWEEAPLLGKGPASKADELVSRVLAETNVVPLPLPLPRFPDEPHSQSPAHSQPGAPVVDAGEALPAQARARRAGPTLLAVAATVLVASAAGLWAYAQRDTYSTGIGEQRFVRLEDGSTMDLNSRSKVRVRFSAGHRNVELLEGQALFHVAKDRLRPFVVATDSTHVRAVGTQFDVYRKGAGTVVTVVEGHVAVSETVFPAPSSPSSTPAPTHDRSDAVGEGLRLPALLPQTDSVSRPGAEPLHPVPTPAEGEILLAAGEQVTVTPQAVSQPQPADLPLATAWTQRKIAFKAAPLREVVVEFNRYNPHPLVITDPNLEGVKISGVFSSTDPDSLLRFLRQLPNISVQQTEGEIRIARK